ncbi:Isoquinoline 1-oxidoreductase subunit beta [Usitatibacter rugosus]|uniref:Isoquinoline 1-oxidoreductase subunit beta n=1 Tax=Usitatibacter rugosus TaxID=2732067 RepID=A0A6M4GXR4_9PROT|nr:xanthine dehydrogenase family protein molybdopterin-binding subunit [Usitatibacter rugosus]QJR11795.1 Isoquinoline 1-oxidoreductase subunit beta [Usitatibacter rugosus]
MTTSVKNASRRKFLQSSGALSGALVIAFYLPMGGRAYAQAPKMVYPPNAFLRIGKDNTVTVIVKHLEFGQGVQTSLPMLICEELECDWTKVKAELAPADPVYGNIFWGGMQGTGGSSSVANSFDQLRLVGAQARTMLIQAAATQWKLKPEELKADKGFVTGPGGKKASFGSLADAAMKLPIPQDVKLKDPKDWKLIGKPTRRLDAPDKVDGKAVFGIDVKRPNLHTAVVMHPPVFGAQVKSFNVDKVKAVSGVTHVIEIASGVAVVGKGYWAAKSGRDVLEVEWDIPRTASTLSTERLRADYRDLAGKPGGAVAKKADNPEAIKGAVRTISAEYEFPFLAHAAMEPLNCTVELRADGAEIWAGTQMPGVDQAAAAKVFGFKPEQVKVNTLTAGGGFGRRANPNSDWIIDACEIAKGAQVPVKLVWSREDDIRGGYYRPMYVHRADIGLDAQGNIVGWNHVVVGQSILTGTPFEAFAVKDGVDGTSVEGVPDTKYDIPNLAVTLRSVGLPVPPLWWRSVGHTHTGFVMETLIDEIAAASKQDPVAFRRKLLAKDPRFVKVLDLAAEKAGWGSPLPAGRARGVAIVESFGTICAQVAEVSLENGAPKVHRVTAAIDCGPVVNPMTVEAQVQSAIAYGLGAVLYSELTLKDGGVQQSNFHDYRVLRLSDMPQVSVFTVPGGTKVSGVGEPGTPPIGPAVANALAALTGKRARVLPLANMKWA